MKIVTYSKIGYNHPSQANWSYGIFKVDIIDSKNDYAMSYTARETFGGDSRFRDKLKKQGIRVIETKGVYECPTVTGVSKMPDMESDEFIKEVLEAYKQA